MKLNSSVISSLVYTFAIPIQRSYQYHSMLFHKHILIFRFIWCNFFGGGCADSLWDLSSQPETEFSPCSGKHRVLTIRLPGNSWVPKFSNLVFIIFIWQFQHPHFLLPAVSTFSHLLWLVYLCLCYLWLRANHFSWTFFFMRVVNIFGTRYPCYHWLVCDFKLSRIFSPRKLAQSSWGLIHQRANRRKKNYNPTDSRMKKL